MMRVYRAALRGFAVLAAVAAFAGSADAHKIEVIHSFCGEANCADGGSGMSLVRDAAGNLYGTAAPTSSDYGSIFELSPAGGKWMYRALYHFSQGGELTPNAPLIVDVNGDLYGSVKDYRPLSRGGMIFKLSHSADGSTWTYRKLHYFTQDRYGFEGAMTYAGAAAGLPYDGVSTLYGPSGQGGRDARGTIFALIPPATGKTWDYKIIYSFCRRDDCADGWGPFDTLTMDGAGNLYGAAAAGGKNAQGVIFELSPGAKHWTNTVLHDFCSQADCGDGQQPFGNSVARDAAGNLYGTTPQGGTCPAGGCGVLYKIASDGQQSVLHNFCSAADCADGTHASFGVSLGAGGTVYGVTTYGGGNDQDPSGKGGGTIFSFDGKYHVLHSFCARTNCTDGAYPGPLVADGAGHFYGITESAGATGHGTVFEFTP
jgi:uncharacterized repeat protein (TIGR03803 family)